MGALTFWGGEGVKKQRCYFFKQLIVSNHCGNGACRAKVVHYTAKVLQNTPTNYVLGPFVLHKTPWQSIPGKTRMKPVSNPLATRAYPFGTHAKPAQTRLQQTETRFQTDRNPLSPR